MSPETACVCELYKKEYFAAWWGKWVEDGEIRVSVRYSTEWLTFSILYFPLLKQSTDKKTGKEWTIKEMMKFFEAHLLEQIYTEISLKDVITLWLEHSPLG